ncbi:UDP-xylose and UDP-N-acetylglucosamine transporter isoform X2 [Orussus abietinus]|uniref:UDP-xylose and UDP-N-acetylglucosamine transporter isoform X2 n=1 Tax=Orussus abietinus TaxID=222816 RepID=UPI0006259B8A|nr:UDP-xylose and UDP-N-acetylglucosamine transporter isoform X2 [Orussus abietinus]
MYEVNGLQYDVVESAEVHKILQNDPGSGNLITFSQFLFISIEGFFLTSKCGTVKPAIGIKDYTLLVLMFFVSNVCNNYAFDFNIPMPLHMIFRSGSLIANMIMGIIVLNKRYPISKYLSVSMITLGIAICTLVSSNDIKSTRPAHLELMPTTPMEDLFWWTIGISLLVVALFISARMGIYQETLHQRYGKHPREALYYTHLLPMPFFLLLIPNILEHIKMALKSSVLELPLIGLQMPKTIVYLVGNVLSQYICIRSVYVCTSECTSLTVTLVLTLRKFISLIFSILYFKNPFTIYHWIGTILVFTGTVVFTEIIPKIQQSLKFKTEAKKME